MIRHVTFAIDWRCNMRCITCGLWKYQLEDKLLTLEEIEKIFSSKFLSDLSTVYLTGGEPYIKDDFVEIVKVIHKCLPGVIFTWATNAFTPELIERKTKEILDMGCRIDVNVSLSGKEATHDMLYGVEGSHKKALETFDRLKRLGVFPSFVFTVFPSNAGEIMWMYDFARSLGTTVWWEFGRSDARYGNIKDLLTYSEERKRIVLAELKQLVKFEPKQIYLYRYAEHVLYGEKLDFRCLMLKENINIDPYGSVYPCDGFYEALKLGNVRQNSLDEILNSEKTGKIKEMIRKKACPECKGCEISCNILYSLRNDKRFLKRFLSSVESKFLK